MKRLVLILFSILLFADISISSIPPSSGSITNMDNRTTSDLSNESNITKEQEDVWDTEIKPTIDIQSDSRRVTQDAQRLSDINSNQKQAIENDTIEPSTGVIERLKGREWDLLDLGIIAYCCVALFLISKLTIWGFKTVSKILDKISKFFNGFETWFVEIKGKLTDIFSNGNKEKTLQKDSDKNTIGSGINIKHFGLDFFKKAAIMSALEECQKYHKKVHSGQELSKEQINTLKHFSLFKDIARQYKNEGMSRWGGLAWFCREFTSIYLDKTKKNEIVKPNIKELTDKLAFNSTAIAVLTIDLNLNSADIKAIGSSVEVANKIIDRHSIIKNYRL